MCALAHVADSSQTFPEVRQMPEPEITTCPFRKSYLDVVVVQPGQDRDGDNGPGALDRSTFATATHPAPGISRLSFCSRGRLGRVGDPPPAIVRIERRHAGS